MRVSTEEQKERETIQTQLSAINTYTLPQAIKVKYRYADDGVTSQIPFEKRPDGSRLLKDAEQGKFDTLLVFKVDRIARDTEELLRVVRKLGEHGVSVRSITEPFETSSPMGKFALTMLGGLAQMERDGFRERSSAGMKRGASEGRWMGGRAPFGYQITHGKLEPNETESKIVRDIFSEYIAGATTQQIADLMNARRVPVPAAWRFPDLKTQWKDTTVHKVLRNEVYKGVHRWNKIKTVRQEGIRQAALPRANDEHITIPVTPIVSEAEYEATQKRLKSNLRFSRRNARRTYTLRGLVRCGVCKRKRTGSGGEDYPVYSCSIRQSEGAKCNSPTLHAKPLEAAVWRSMIEQASDPSRLLDTLRGEHAKTHDEESLAKREQNLTGELAKKTEERGKVLTLMRRDVITEAEAESQLRQIELEQQALERDLERLKNTRQSSKLIEKSLQSVADALKRIRRAGKKATPEEQSEMIRTLIREVVVYPESGDNFRLVFRYVSPEDS